METIKTYPRGQHHLLTVCKVFLSSPSGRFFRSDPFSSIFPLMGTPCSLPHFLLICGQSDIQWSDSSIPQQQVSRARQSAPDSTSFVFCPTYGWDSAFMRHWYTAMALLSINTRWKVMCIRHGGRWQGVCLPATAPGVTCWISEMSFLCLFVLFLLDLSEHFSFELYSWKNSAWTLVAVYEKASQLQRDTKHLLMLYVCLWKSPCSEFRLYPCLRCLTQLVHIKFLRAFSEVELFNCGRVTRRPKLAGEGGEYWNLYICFKNWKFTFWPRFLLGDTGLPLFSPSEMVNK